MWTILVATEKQFASIAIEKMKEVASAYHEVEFRVLESYSSKEELKIAVADVNALIIRSDKIGEDIIEVASALKLIVRAGSGYDNIDLSAATERGIVVMNTPGQNANAVAELAFGLLVTMIRGKFNGLPGTELSGKVMGLHGYGNIGKCMARIAKGFEMTILAYDPYVTEVTNGVELWDSKHEMYAECDFISLSLPENEDTKLSIGYKLLSKTKEKVVLINTARRELIEEDDLLRIMSENPEFRFCSDIPPARRDEFETKFGDRVLLTKKKMGAQTAEANINAGVAAVRQAIAYFQTGNNTFQVN